MLGAKNASDFPMYIPPSPQMVKPESDKLMNANYNWYCCIIPLRPIQPHGIPSRTFPAQILEGVKLLLAHKRSYNLVDLINLECNMAERDRCRCVDGQLLVLCPSAHGNWRPE